MEHFDSPQPPTTKTYQFFFDVRVTETNVKLKNHCLGLNTITSHMPVRMKWNRFPRCIMYMMHFHYHYKTIQLCTPLRRCKSGNSIGNYQIRKTPNAETVEEKYGKVKQICCCDEKGFLCREACVAVWFLSTSNFELFLNFSFCF